MNNEGPGPLRQILPFIKARQVMEEIVTERQARDFKEAALNTFGLGPGPSILEMVEAARVPIGNLFATVTYDSAGNLVEE